MKTTLSANRWRIFSLIFIITIVLVAILSCGKKSSVHPRFGLGAEDGALSLVFSWQPTSAKQGDAINPVIKVEIQSGGVVDTSYNENVTIAFSSTGNPNSATLGGTLTATAVNGVATFDDITVNDSHDYYQLTATSGSITAVESSRFSIFPSTPIFRSVGPGNQNTLDTGGGNELTIVGVTATFENALPLNVGVGDVIVYNGGATVTFIHGRSNEKTYQVRTVSGGTPTAIAGDDGWEIYRAYDSLFNAERGDENNGIPDAVEAFETWLDGKDILSATEVWNIACYAGLQPESGSVFIDGWNTGPASYLRVYTPIYLSDAGINQRHSGNWNNGKYRRADTDSGAVLIRDNYVRINGLQFSITRNTGDYLAGITINNIEVGGSDIRISNNIIERLQEQLQGSTL